MIKKIALVVFLLVSGLSAVCYYHFSNKLNIDEILLAKKDNFRITNQALEFKLSQLRNLNYNLVLKFMTDDNAEAVALNKATYSAGKYKVVVQLIDVRQNIETLSTINDGSKMRGARSQGYEEWYFAYYAPNRPPYALQFGQ